MIKERMKKREGRGEKKRKTSPSTLLNIPVHITANLQVSIWKQVFKKEQSPSDSSVCFWMILRKWRRPHCGPPFFVALSHSSLVPCGQNSWTFAPAKAKLASGPISAQFYTQFMLTIVFFSFPTCYF